MSRCWIVVPCYNEADRLQADAFVEFARRRQDICFLFVNDGSTDRTLERLEELQRRQPNCFVVQHLKQNCGKAEAVRHGMLAALDHRPQFVGFWDADLSTPLEEIPRYCDVLARRNDIEIVLGTRLGLSGRRIERRPVRRLLGRLFATTASIVLGIRLYDTQCGAKLFRATPATRAVFAQPFQSRWIFDVELLARFACISAGMPLQQIVYELPLDTWHEVPGSKLRSGDFLRAVAELAAIYRRYVLSSEGVAPLSHETQDEAPMRRAA